MSEEASNQVGECVLVDELPAPKEYNRLRQAVGWRTHREDVLEMALPNSLYCVCAFVGHELVGMARIIGDGGMAYYIQDVIVVPAYQRRGIGTQLMDQIMAYLSAHAYTNTVIGLMSAPGKEAFYEKYGFTTRPTDRLGAGMTIHWQVK